MQLAGTSPDEQAAYDELAAYTLVHDSPLFIHQHVVDAYAAQYATAGSKPIGVAFALIGLYLHLERGLDGREVQRAHMRLARARKDRPRFDPPTQRGELTAHDVLAEPPGPARDEAIGRWCEAVWQTWRASRDRVIALLRDAGEEPPSHT